MGRHRHAATTARPRPNASRQLLAAMAELYAPHVERTPEELLAGREQIARDADLRGRRQCELRLASKGRG